MDNLETVLERLAQYGRTLQMHAEANKMVIRDMRQELQKAQELLQSKQP